MSISLEEQDMIAVANDPLDCLLQEPFEKYLEKAKTHLTSHALADFRKCPLLYWKKKQGLIPDEDRPAFMVGRAAHKLILEGQGAFDREFAIGGPINKKTGRPYGANTQAWVEWAAEQGKPVLTDAQFSLISEVAQSVRSHRLACDLLAEGLAEGVVRREYCGMPAQARMDWVNPSRGLVDLKTCDCLDFFAADARRYGYLYQVGFYAALLRWATGAKLPAWFIAVEKVQPCRVGIWRVDDSALDYARKQNEAAMAELIECQRSGVWPTGYEEALVFDSI